MHAAKVAGGRSSTPPQRGATISAVMSGPDEPLDRAFVRREIDFEEQYTSEPGRGASVTWIVLAAGLALSVLLFKLGIWFFFLPIIIPFGLGRRSMAGRLMIRPGTIRLEGAVLSLEARSPFGSSRRAAIDVSAGVHVSVTAGAFDSGAATVRFEAAGGSFEVRCADLAAARELMRRVEVMLVEASVMIRRD